MLLCSLVWLCKKIWLKLCFLQVVRVAQVSTLVNSKQSFVAPYCEPFDEFFSS